MAKFQLQLDIKLKGLVDILWFPTIPKQGVAKLSAMLANKGNLIETNEFTQILQQGWCSTISDAEYLHVTLPI